MSKSHLEKIDLASMAGSINVWHHVSNARESISDNITKLSCLSNLKKQDQLPIHEVLGGTGDCILFIFK